MDYQAISVEENSIYDDDVAAKIEFLQLHKDARFKTGLTREDIGKFWADTGVSIELVSLSKSRRFFFQKLSDSYMSS